MTEEKAPEVEREESPEPSGSELVVAFVDEAVRAAESLGKAFVSALEDASNLMVIKVDPTTREHLDLLVDTGVSPNRRKAAVALIAEGLKASDETMSRIRKTQAQITELKQQMRSLVGANSM
jgi:hypothetical protein